VVHHALTVGIILVRVKSGLEIVIFVHFTPMRWRKRGFRGEVKITLSDLSKTGFNNSCYAE
jgi:hypothetical protein